MYKANKSYFFTYTLFYTLSFFPLLLVTSYFQDDWLWFGQPDALARWSELGRPYNHYMIEFMHALSGSLSFSRLLSFIFYYLSGLFIFKIFKNDGYKDSTAFWVGFLTALMPMNFARVTMCITQYVLSFFLFILAIYFMQEFFKKNNIRDRILSLFLFFISFVTNSFLVIYIIPALLIYRYQKKNIPFWKVPLRYFDFYVLPILFFTLNKYFFPAYGDYANYNAITPLRLYNAPLNLQGAFSRLFDHLIWLPSHDQLLVLIIFLLITFPFLAFAFRSQIFIPEKTKLISIPFGAAATWLAIFPYAVVVRMPHNLDWDSRHYLTAHLTVGFLILSLIAFTKYNRLKLLLLVGISCFFVAKNFVIYTEYVKDGHITMALMEKMRTNSIIRDQKTFIYDEVERPHRTLSRFWRHYELSNMQRLAFGNSKRLAINAFDAGVRLDTKKQLAKLEEVHRDATKWPGNGHHEYEPDSHPFMVKILPGDTTISMAGAFCLTLLQLTNGTAYKEKLSTLLKLEINELSRADWNKKH